MKPLYLKMKGINSFIEEQEIDFSKLTKNGFFGIFGPTGSGKSTILDGITLALYGNISRKSGSFINANLTSARVSFRFLMQGKEAKTYLVEREFRLDQKTGNPRSGRCMIADVTGDEDMVLADGIREVNQVCEEIIGLSYDDFTRTVVLPQGKFSEFLTLKGTERNAMLERIFRLERYGESLMEKLKGRDEKETAKLQRLQGEINAYGEINPEEVAIKEVELSECIEKIGEIQKDSDAWQEKWRQGETVWKLQEEYQELQKEKVMLDEEREAMRLLEKKIDHGEKALGVQPFCIDYETSERKFLMAKKELKKAEDQFLQMQEQVENTKKKFEMAKENWERENPILQRKQEKANDALVLQKQWKDLEQEGVSKKNNLVQLKNFVTKQEGIFEKQQEQTNDLEKKITEMERSKKNLSIASEEKTKAQEGLLLENDLVGKQQQLVSLEDKEKCLWKEILAVQEKRKTSNELLKSIEGDLVAIEETLKNHRKNNPEEGELEFLLQQKTTIGLHWKRYQQIKVALDNGKDAIVQWEEEQVRAKKQEETNHIVWQKMKKEKEQQEICLAVNKLQESLLEGQPCPVCGATDHIFHEKANEERVLSFDVSLLEAQTNTLEDIRLLIKDLEMRIQRETEENKKREEEIVGFGVDFSSFSLEKVEENYAEKKKFSDTYKQTEKAIEKSIGEKKDEYHKITNEVKTKEVEEKERQRQLLEVKKEIEDLKKKIFPMREQYQELQRELNVSSFAKKQKDLQEKEREKNHLEEKIAQWNEERKKIGEEQEKIRVALQEGKNKLGILQTEVEHIRSRWQEKKDEIKGKIGAVSDICAYLLDIEGKQKELEKDYETMNRLRIQEENQFLVVKTDYETNKGRILEVENNRDSRKSSFLNQLCLAGFEKEEQWKEALLAEEDLVFKKERLSIYQERIQKNNINIEVVVEKLDGKRLVIEEWEKITDTLAEKKQLFLEEQGLRSQLTQQVLQLQEKLKKVKGLLDKKEKLEHILAMLLQLKRLFAGKKFVQFVAMERLKYITLEATKLLMEISGGNYGLMVGESGNFHIRDYKNGGVEREASTLSGGETFLASLSLALALSTQIQMSQEAPLGFFFLDEGFGTLDEMLLEEVLSALERLPNRNRAIGLISHVSEIKERVPVKLVITPAQMGKQGSEVHIVES